MSPFEQYLKESKEIREKYQVLIMANPNRKNELLSEMNSILKQKLDECEQKEIERSKYL